MTSICGEREQTKRTSLLITVALQICSQSGESQSLIDEESESLNNHAVFVHNIK
jgi:hypothetical protein